MSAQQFEHDGFNSPKEVEVAQRKVAQHTPGPCKSCPWAEKGQPLITDELRECAKRGEWFCCHVNMGTCHGAERFGEAKRAAIAKATGSNA